MTAYIPSYDEALSLLKDYNQSESLLKHAYAVEGVMRYMARKHRENEEKWGIIGLIHDLDYEQFPQEHCAKTQEILRQMNWPEEYIRAVASHGWGMYNDIKPETILEKTLFTVDELTGLVTAAALVRPSKSVKDLEVKSVVKKWKDISFAAGVNREVIDRGIEMLEADKKELITDTIVGMREVADKIGL